MHYVLGLCASLDDLRELLADITLVGLQDKLTGTVAPLHWIFTDLSGKSLVVEQIKQGLNAYENPVGVLTNSPDFPWQMTNLRSYIGAAPEQTEQADWGWFPDGAFWAGRRNERPARGATPTRPFRQDRVPEAPYGAAGDHAGKPLLQAFTSWRASPCPTAW